MPAAFRVVAGEQGEVLAFVEEKGNEPMTDIECGSDERIQMEEWGV